jgi:hypothetical protein
MRKLLIVSLFIVLLFSGCNRKYIESPNNVWEEYIKTKYATQHILKNFEEDSYKKSIIENFEDLESGLLYLLEQRDKNISNISYDEISRRLIDFRLKMYDRRDRLLEQKERNIEQIFSNRNNVINSVINDVIKFLKFVEYDIENDVLKEKGLIPVNSNDWDLHILTELIKITLETNDHIELYSLLSIIESFPERLLHKYNTIYYRTEYGVIKNLPNYNNEIQDEIFNNHILYMKEMIRGEK